jgi:hypothetical protein
MMRDEPTCGGRRAGAQTPQDGGRLNTRAAGAIVVERELSEALAPSTARGRSRPAAARSRPDRRGTSLPDRTRRRAYLGP